MNLMNDCGLTPMRCFRRTGLKIYLTVSLNDVELAETSKKTRVKEVAKKRKMEGKNREQRK